MSSRGRRVPKRAECFQSSSTKRLLDYSTVSRLRAPRPIFGRLGAIDSKKLLGGRAGQYSIRINDQYRICFIWENGEAVDVVITDYH